MQLDVEGSPPAFVRAQLEVECTCSVPRSVHAVWLNVGCIGFGHYMYLHFTFH